MSWTLTTSGATISKAGTHANSTIIASVATLGLWSDMAEGRIEIDTKKAWLDNYATLPTGVKYLLGDVASSLIAMNIIAYDNTGYLPREADMLMNNNSEIITAGITALKLYTSLQTP